MPWRNITAVAAAVFFFCRPVWAQVVFNEIMYDLPGTDTGREWVEITNTGASAVTIATSSWKFFEANTNHALSLFQGSVSIPAGGFAVIADEPSKFLLDWPGFSGTIFDSSFSLSNAGEPLALKSSTTTVSDQVTYASTTGAGGDGNSLQKINGIWKALPPTPGAASPSQTASSATSSDQSLGANSNTATTTDHNGADMGNGGSTELSSVPTNNNSNWPVDPQMFSRIVGPTSAIAGADVAFRGEAVGLDKQPLANPRFVWNFGDGAAKEGEAVLHGYNFPGDYLVVLEASGGKFSSESRLRIKVIAADISVSAVVPGLDGKIELSNNSSQELDLSWWRLQSGNQFFTLPKNTKILGRAKLPLSSAVTGLDVNTGDIGLLYPNGVIASRFEPPATSSPALPAATVKKDSTPTQTAAVTVAAKNPVPRVSLPAASVQKPPDPVKVKVVVPPLPPPSQTAAVSAAFDRQNVVSPVVQPSEKNTKTPSPFWLYALGGIIILGTGFALLPKPSKPKSQADEFTVIED